MGGEIRMEPEKLFAEEVTKAGKVWTLASDKGWAASASEDYEDAEVLPFWSAADKAAAAATENWKGYAPHALPLAAFLEEWLPGMHGDVTLAGVNWGSDRKGMEMEPLKLAREILDVIQVTRTQVKLQNFASISEFDKELTEMLKG